MIPKNNLLTTNTIREIYTNELDDLDIKFSPKEFKKFLKFLEIDIYDWIKENFDYYIKNE